VALNMGMSSITTWLRRWGNSNCHHRTPISPTDLGAAKLWSAPQLLSASSMQRRLLAPAALSNGNDDKPDEFAADPAGYYCRSTLASRV
jgi:hypothetical protein